MKKIQVLKPRYRVEECLNEIKECLEIGWTGMGFKTIDFENKWKEYTKLNNAHFLNSATAGLHLAVKILKEKYRWDENSEIITTPFTFVSTNHAIMYENLKPVFADIDNSLNLDPKDVENKITKNTKAIIFVGIGGNTKNMIEIIEIAKKHNLAIILDAAHMAGSYYKGRHVGFDVDVAVFSFQAVKNLPTADSGMICFKDEEDDKKARELSWLGINKDTFSRNQGFYKWDYDVKEIGYKYHGNSIMAALGIVGLKYLDLDNSYRRQIAFWYEQNLKNEKDIEIIYHESNETSRHLFQVAVENREKVIDFLVKHGIFPGVHYKINTKYDPYKVDYKCENAEYYSDRILTLPIHTYLTKDDIDKISDTLIKALKYAN
jgi:dTDP-4-amino-4,6-dideoxygalactose transaminase